MQARGAERWMRDTEASSRVLEAGAGFRIQEAGSSRRLVVGWWWLVAGRWA